jgi:hypothetical protein
MCNESGVRSIPSSSRSSSVANATEADLLGHIHPDGKSNSSVRVISLDAFTVESLRQYLEVLDGERAVFGSRYDTSHSKLMRFEDGRRLHADTLTLRCNRLVDLGALLPVSGDERVDRCGG